MAENKDTWLTEAEAAIYLKVPEEALKLARYRKKVKSIKICRTVQYTQEWLDEFREGKCAANQSSSGERILHFGKSMFPPEEESHNDEYQQAQRIRKRLNASLRNGCYQKKPRSSPHPKKSKS